MSSSTSYVYKFSAPGTGEFECELETRQCAAYTVSAGHRTKQRCQRKTSKVLPYCWQHMQSEQGLRIGPSLIKEAGQGLFATQLFKKGDVIGEYKGEIIGEKELTKRYGDYTAPYALELSPGKYVDGACVRYPVVYANHIYKRSPLAHVQNSPDPSYMAAAAAAGGGKRRRRGGAKEVDYKACANSQLQSWGGKGYLMATRDILPGQEIFTDYGPAYKFGESGVVSKVVAKRSGKS